MTDKIRKTDAEWRAQLSDLAYKVTRQKGTERAFTHDDFPKGPGTFTCVNCGAPLFDAATKYDSGSGWPSFYAPIAPGAVEEHPDNSLLHAPHRGGLRPLRRPSRPRLRRRPATRPACATA